MEWTCRCGAVAADVEPKGGTRAVCYCRFCRDFARRTGAEGALDPQGGSDLFQVGPEAVRFVRGGDRLAWMRLSDKGPLRWYTTCCGTPLANTLASRSVPFVTLMAHRFAEPDALGPVRVRVFRRDATGRVPDDATGGTLPLYLGFARRVLKSFLTGGWRRNPFFGPDGRPVAEGERVAD
jgi:hypothetical protein